MRRLFPTVIVLAVLLSIVTLLGVAAIPGWRHRHTGTSSHSHGQVQNHTHSHSHSHARSHSHSHSHSHAHGHSHAHEHPHRVASTDENDSVHLHEGWHIHLSLLGFELTLWDPWSSDGIDSEVPPRSVTTAKKSLEEREVVTVSAAEGLGGWISLFLIEWGPLPKRISPPNVLPSERCKIPTLCDLSLARPAPPSPPPEHV